VNDARATGDRTTQTGGTEPVAVVRSAGGSWWVWLLPAAALAFAVWIGREALAERGPEIRIRFAEGHGLGPGDALKHLGIEVGEVTAVELADDVSGVTVHVRLQRDAAGLARAGTRFWIARPHVSLAGVEGLETLLGARYVAVAPSASTGDDEGDDVLEFRGLDTPPLGDVLEPGGLEVRLEGPRRFGLSPGAPVFYRQVEVGGVLDVALSSDATSVDVRLRIRPDYVALVRSNTRFWQVSGFDLRLALTEGLAFELESLGTLITGGVAFATPDEPGATVRAGHAFPLHEAAEDDWLAWRPQIPTGALSASGRRLPDPVRAILAWKEGTLWRTSEELVGNLLYVETETLGETALLGPRDLFRTPAGARGGTATLQGAGRDLPLDPTPLWEQRGLSLVAAELPGTAAWPRASMRAPTEPEDGLLVRAGAPPRALARRRMEATETSWRVDPDDAFDPAWHGAAVVARSDGALVGMLLVERERGFVAPLTAELVD